MNVENFSYYLLDTSKLKEIGYQDLEDLIVKYPYCQNLHYLICKKSQIEEHQDFDKWLHLAATYSTDRAYLYQLLLDVDFEKDYTLETIDLDDLSKETAEEKLELPSLTPEVIVHDSREDAIISKTLAALQAQQMNQNTPSSLELDDDDDAPFATFSSLLDEGDLPVAVEDIESVEGVESVEDVEDVEGVEDVEDVDFVEKIEIEKEEIATNIEILNTLEEKLNAPQPKSAFNSYKAKTEVTSISDLPFSDEQEMAEHRKRIEEKLELEQEKRKKREEKKKKEQALISFADESLKDREDTASETLANILALQGHKERAILMYEKLKLQIPEKSAFFAAQIEKLKIS
jgi:hypothetical protein